MKALINLLFPSGLSIVLLILFSSAMQTYAQSTILKLPTTNNTSSFDITKSDDANIFRMFGDGGFYLGGTFGSGVIPIEGEGTRLMWYPSKASLRIGNVLGTNWDDNEIGNYSVAMGNNTNASGFSSTAMGSITRATGDYTTAMGYFTIASGENSLAIGYNTIANGISSIAMGHSTIAEGNYSSALGNGTTASGNYSTAMGSSTTASGFSSTAMGWKTTASGIASTAMGEFTTASGGNSIAMGYGTTASENSTAMGFLTTASGLRSTAIGNRVSTNNFTGAFIIGDHSTNGTGTTHNSSAEDQMTMRFAGGYRLFTNSDANVGALLNAGANSWTTISDSLKKENFIYADGEQFLSSLSKLRLGSWNYKTQDAKEYRHYGSMAQEIFHYFGKDDLGTIGNDTTLATADMDGIIMICLQALERRTAELQKSVKRISELEGIVSDQNIELSSLQNNIEEVKNEFQEFKEIVSALLDDKNFFTDLVGSK